MYKYPLTTSQEARINLDRKAANDGYEDANADYPAALSDEELKVRVNLLVNQALDQQESLVDDEDEYRARYVDTYCKAYAKQIQSRQGGGDDQ